MKEGSWHRDSNTSFCSITDVIDKTCIFDERRGTCKWWRCVSWVIFDTEILHFFYSRVTDFFLAHFTKRYLLVGRKYSMFYKSWGRPAHNRRDWIRLSFFVTEKRERERETCSRKENCQENSFTRALIRSSCKKFLCSIWQTLILSSSFLLDFFSFFDSVVRLEVRITKRSEDAFTRDRLSLWWLERRFSQLVVFGAENIIITINKVPLTCCLFSLLCSRHSQQESLHPGDCAAQFSFPFLLHLMHSWQSAVRIGCKNLQEFISDD